MADSVSRYRELFEGTLIERRSTYLNDVDQLAAIQISVLMMQKEVALHGVSSKDMLALQKRINSNKLNEVLSCSPTSTPHTLEILDICSFEEIYSSYVTFLKHSNLLDNADVKCYLRSKSENLSEKALSENKDDKMIETEVKNNPLMSPAPSKSVEARTPLIPKKLTAMSSPSGQSPSELLATPFAQSPKNSSNLQLRRIIIAYLQLIVNSRNEIALARIIDVPTRGIDHKSFTDIRKLSSEKGMPMYQVISSFARQVVIGGKGYAPGEAHALFKHKQSLLEFMELMDNLQTVLDEGESISNVIMSMFKLLKTAFVRAKDPVFSPKTVSIVVQELVSVTKSKFLKKVKDSKLEMCFLLRDYIDFLSCLAGNDVTVNSSQLCGILSTPDVSSTTYKKIPTLATNFSTPEETPKKSKSLLTKDDNDDNSCGDEKETVMEETPVKRNESENEEKEAVDSEEHVNPIKLIRCPVSDEKSNDDQKITKITKMLAKEKDEVISKVEEKKPVKKTKPPPPAVKKRTVTAKEKSKCAKKIKLLSGQKTLSQFFTK